ncbi:Uncharacterized protein GBIM_12709 [Gryllus bimaculatus]|nr:Uncharacterized protein GBIM_12709 [Gryllus bimaculatus]
MDLVETIRRFGSYDPSVERRKQSWTYDGKSFAAAFILACCFLVFLNVYAYKQSIANELENPNVTAKVPTYALFGKNVDSGYLRHVIAVFERLGFQRVDVSSNWDVLWAHEYPFRNMYSVLKNLKPHQKVNHFPGSGYITNKLELSTSELPHLPRAFRMPQDKEKLLEYAKADEDLMFVQKDNNHRGITIKHINELNLSANNTFIQEYVSKPFLIDGYKFDIGVYTILTSINPLRVYIYDGDILFRFCPVKYYPFDPQILDKYVVGDDYLPIWKVPSLKKYYVDKGFSMKDTFNAFVESQGKDPSTIWTQVNEAIRNIYLQKESKIRQSTLHYQSSTNFFEMVRIDFVIDEDMNVFLMEANMSPNLSSAHYPPNQLLYEQVIFNTLALVGVAQRIKSSDLQIRSVAEEDMMVALKNIVVFPHLCSSHLCQTCENALCDVCKHCLTIDVLNQLKNAYKEHVNRLDCRRVFPPAMTPPLPNITSYGNAYSPENQRVARWFLGKCHVDQSWCS